MKPPTRLTPWLGSIIILLVLQGCGSALKGEYIASATQPRVKPEDVAAQASAPDPQASAINTQDTYLRLIDRMQQENLWFASLAHIDALEQQWGRTPQSRRLRADALRHTGQASESSALYRELLGTPLEGAGYHGLGLLAGARDDYTQAVQMLEQAQRKHPTDALLLSDLGYANLRSGRVAEARVPLMQALQLRPDSKQVQANLALYLQASRQPEQADALMEAQGMTEATRRAIREAAAQISTGMPPAHAAVSARSTPLNPAIDEIQAPLVLRSSGWSSVRSGAYVPLPERGKAAPPPSSPVGAPR